MKQRSIVTLAAAVSLMLPLAAQGDPLSVFQPPHSRPISVTPADARGLRALPQLTAFGTVSGTPSAGSEDLATVGEAARKAGYSLRLPAAIPAELGAEPHVRVTRRAEATFTFLAARAADWAREHQVPLTPVPAGLDGATFTATLQPVTIVTYGAPRSEKTRGVRRGQFLAVVQGPVPAVSARGASLQALGDWFAAQPGVSPQLVAQIRALGDPVQTLPIPIRFDRQTATPVKVDGVQGLAIGDETGIGSAIVWTRDGRLYAVGGTFTQQQVLALADHLK